LPAMPPGESRHDGRAIDRLPSAAMAEVAGEDVTAGAAGKAEQHDHRGAGRSQAGIAVVVIVVVAAAALRPVLEQLFDRPAVAHWATIFVAIAVAAMPFLVLGVSISAAIEAFVPAGLLPRLIPDRPALAVPCAAIAGVALPGCEWGSVEI
jgi:uncharacterized membrane protein YraQ (UPF0718 family)